LDFNKDISLDLQRVQFTCIIGQYLFGIPGFLLLLHFSFSQTAISQPSGTQTSGTYPTGNHTYGIQTPKLSYYDSSKTMPPFLFYQSNGTWFSPENLNPKHSTVLIYFKTDCPFCEKEAELISKNLKDFKKADFVFITRADTADIRKFAILHKLENNKKIKFLQDKDKKYHSYYTARFTPSIHIYDKNKKLTLFKDGMLNKEELQKYIH
jgi:peroxiredoxin